MLKTAVAVLCTAMLAVGGLSAEELGGGPKIVVKQTRFDLGNIQEGSQATHTFEVRNAGNQALVIERIQPS